MATRRFFLKAVGAGAALTTLPKVSIAVPEKELTPESVIEGKYLADHTARIRIRMDTGDTEFDVPTIISNEPNDDYFTIRSAHLWSIAHEGPCEFYGVDVWAEFPGIAKWINTYTPQQICPEGSTLTMMFAANSPILEIST